MSAEERNPDSVRSNEDDVMVPSSQNSDSNILPYRDEFQADDAPKALTEDNYIPFSRPTFEDGFCDLGPSQNIELQLTDSHRVEGDPGGAESLDTESPVKVYVRETSVESQGSAVPSVETARAPRETAVVEEDEDETELPATRENERTLTPGEADALLPDPSVDLDGSNSSEDITAVPTPAPMEVTQNAKKRPLGDSCQAPAEETKKRARTQEPPLSPESHSPPTSSVVASSAAPSPTAPKIPSPAASSIHTSPSAPNGTTAVPLPFFVRFGLDVFNSVEQQQKFHRDIVVPGTDLSVRRFQVTCDQLIAALCQWFASAGVPISPQSSLTTTTPSDSDSLGYLADMSSSSGGGGGGGGGGSNALTAANSLLSLASRRSSVTFHGPSSHDLLRSAGSAPLEYRPTSYVTTDPSRRSDIASNAFTYPPGARGHSGDFSHRLLAGGPLRRNRRSTEVPNTEDPHFKVPGAPLGRYGRHSGSSCSSGPDAELSMEGVQTEPRVSFAPSCASSDSDGPPPLPVNAKNRVVGESGYQSSSDIFDESRPLPKIQEDPGEAPKEPSGRDSSASSSSSSSLREAARRLEEDPFESMRASRTTAKTTQPSSDVTIGPRGAKDVDTDTNTVYRVDAPEVAVYARWKSDRFFYAGSVIGTKLSKDKLKVLFDDGSEGDVRTHDIVMLELLPEGTSVSADRSDSGVYERGYRVLRHLDRLPSSSTSSSSGRNPRGYVVRQLESEQELSLPRGRVAIALEDAQPLLLAHGAPGTPVADVSLENIVHTKRQPKEKRLRASWVATPPPVERLRRSAQTSPRASRSPRTSAQSSPPARSSLRRRERAGGATPTPKEGAPNPASASTVQLSTESTSISETSESGDAVIGASSETATSLWPTQKFLTTNSSLSVEGQTGMLFAAFTFLITGGDGGGVGNTARTDSPSRRLPPPPRPAFNRELLRSSIEDHGGRIVDVVTEELLTSEEVRMVLIASEANRTAKFLQCLAANVPCLRFTWVLDSLAEGVLQPFTSYRLPRGLDLLTGEEAPWIEDMDSGHGSSIFAGVAVAILTDDADIFGEAWERILSLAGAVAQVMPLSAVRTARLERFRAVLVDEKRCSAFSLQQILQRGSRTDCPKVVSTRFFIQGLLHARMLDPTSESEPFRPQLKDL